MVEAAPFSLYRFLPVADGERSRLLPDSQLPHREYSARRFEESTDRLSSIAKAVHERPVTERLLRLFDGPRTRASERELDTRARKLEIFLGEVRCSIEPEGGEMDSSLDGNLKLAKEYPKVDVNMELVRGHVCSFGRDEPQLYT